MAVLTIEQRAQRVKLLLLDCDGVLTDGRITLLDNGEEYKSFNTKDGHGLVLLHRAGLKSGIISGRTSNSVIRRAQDLGISFVRQGTHNKLQDFRDILNAAKLAPEECGFVGDDLPDIPLMRQVGFAIAVADAVPEVIAAAHYVTKLPGGFGAVREVTDLILQSQGHWNGLMKRYLE